ncbi:hypothetical protein JHK87_010435 [Glycine soja]|nr:hypothetical protein JHK87_010435 [Glycine soja]
MPKLCILTTTTNRTATKVKYLPQLTLSHVEVKIPHIQFSVHSSIGASYTGCSTRSIRLNKVLFSFRRFHHYKLSKKKLAT